MDHIVLKVSNNGMIKWYRDGSISVDLDNILTAKGHIFKGMVAVKLDAGYMDLIEVLEHEIKDDYLILKIKNLVTGKINIISQVLDNNQFNHKWYIVGNGYLYSHINKKVYMKKKSC